MFILKKNLKLSFKWVRLNTTLSYVCAVMSVFEENDEKAITTFWLLERAEEFWCRCGTLFTIGLWKQELMFLFLTFHSGRVGGWRGDRSFCVIKPHT